MITEVTDWWDANLSGVTHAVFPSVGPRTPCRKQHSCRHQHALRGWPAAGSTEERDGGMDGMMGVNRGREGGRERGRERGREGEREGERE